MDQDKNMHKTTGAARQQGLTVIAILMILFGLAEVFTGFTHRFVGLVTAQASFATYLGVALGVCYFTAGLLILTRSKRWAAILAIILLCADVVGRIVMILWGLYPVNSFLQTFAIVIGTSLAAFFAIYVALKLKFFR